MTHLRDLASSPLGGSILCGARGLIFTYPELPPKEILRTPLPREAELNMLSIESCKLGGGGRKGEREDRGTGAGDGEEEVKL